MCRPERQHGEGALRRVCAHSSRQCREVIALWDLGHTVRVATSMKTVVHSLHIAISRLVEKLGGEVGDRGGCESIQYALDGNASHRVLLGFSNGRRRLDESRNYDEFSAGFLQVHSVPTGLRHYGHYGYFFISRLFLFIFFFFLNRCV